MNKKFIGFMIFLIGLSVLVLSAANINSVMASSEPQAISQDCSGGNYKDDDWSESKTSVSMTWANTPGFDCLYGVAGVSFEIKAGHYEAGPNACYGASWDQNGWSVWETWTGEGDKGDCQDISHVIVFWTCNCPPTPTDVPPTPTDVPPTPTDVPPTPTDVPPTPTDVPPTPTDVPPTATPLPPDKATGPKDTTNISFCAILFVFGAGLSLVGIKKIVVA